MRNPVARQFKLGWATASSMPSHKFVDTTRASFGSNGRIRAKTGTQENKKKNLDYCLRGNDKGVSACAKQFLGHAY